VTPVFEAFFAGIGLATLSSGGRRTGAEDALTGARGSGGGGLAVCWRSLSRARADGSGRGSRAEGRNPRDGRRGLCVRSLEQRSLEFIISRICGAGRLPNDWSAFDHKKSRRPPELGFFLDRYNIKRGILTTTLRCGHHKTSTRMGGTKSSCPISRINERVTDWAIEPTAPCVQMLFRKPRENGFYAFANQKMRTFQTLKGEGKSFPCEFADTNRFWKSRSGFVGSTGERKKNREADWPKKFETVTADAPRQWEDLLSKNPQGPVARNGRRDYFIVSLPLVSVASLAQRLPTGNSGRKRTGRQQRLRY